jgi:DNA-binding NarL/FixJ family response regulator
MRNVFRKHREGEYKKNINVLIIDDHPVLLEALIALLEQQPDIKVRHVATNLQHALEVMSRTPIDVILVDIFLGVEDGLEASRQIAAFDPYIKIIILSMYDELFYLKHSLAAGARGYITKDEAGDCIVTAIRAVLAGQLFFSPGIVGQLPPHLHPSMQRGEIEHILQVL